MVKSNYNEIKSSKILKTGGNIRVECLTDISCNESDVISLSASISPRACECLNGQVTIGGKLGFNIVYFLEGEIKRKEIGEEFSEKITLENLTDQDVAKVNFCVEGLSTEKGDRLSIYAIISYDLCVEKETPHKVLVDEEGCICDSTKVPYCENLGKVGGVFTLEDEFETSTIKNVLSSSSVAIINSCQCGIGNVVCDGEIILSLLLLMEEKNVILKERRSIPFRLELDAPSLSVTDTAHVTVGVNKTSLKVYVDEGKNKSSVCSFVTITLSGNAYKIKEIEYIGDLFSCEKELSIAKERIENIHVLGCDTITEKYSGKAFCDVPSSASLVNAFDERVYALNQKLEGENLILEGITSCNAMFDVGGSFVTKTAELPFTLKIDTSGENISDLTCVAKEVNATLRNGEVEMTCVLCISYKKSAVKTFDFITSLSETGEPLVEDSAFSLYIPQKGDTLWNVCKALKVSPQVITEQNPQVQYPLSGNEKIIIYRQIK